MSATNLNNGRKSVFTFFLGILYFIIVSIFDYITGFEIATSIFYLFPITFYCKFYGLRGGIVASIFAAILWFLSEVLSNHVYSHPAIPFWNAFVRLGFFIIISVIYVRLEHEINQQRTLNSQLTEKNAEIMRLANIKSEFASMVSHELRTPLTAIKENLAIVYDGSLGPLTMEQKDFLETVKHNVDRLTRLINDILDFQRLTSGLMPFKFTLEDLNRLILGVTKNFCSVAEKKGIALKVELSSDIPQIEIDRDRMSQVLVNLIQNAIRYSDEGAIKIRTDTAGGEIHISVEDQGRGIAPEEMPKLFHSFQRLSSSETGGKQEGTGLGLAISKKIIEAHNGAIDVTSQLGEGSIFKVRLPHRV
ncbi:MAG: HAMP domain-containing histidine kinase [Candidatus Omnitrophica bacterium]|nr:HAMP domain-containing histidine kinase [Candidatus Omnitrophota bacterium]